ncbi:Uncharacterised protein [Mycobacteroides abscessus subsp. abscessus]|nr:Uncharacterised protein [Mycobacteroides abscessus subsp. abscessus]
MATRPSTHLSTNRRDTLASSVNDSSRLRAMTGMYTLSSKAPDRPPTVMAASLPMTCAATCVTASGSTGLTFAMVFSAPEPSTSPSRAACASNESEAVLSSDRPVDCFSTSTTFAPKPSGAFRPVPTAVPPIGSSPNLGRHARTRSIPASI